MGYKHWTTEELQKLRDISNKHTIDELAGIFNRSSDAVKHKCRKERLPYKHTHILWTEEQVNKLEDMWGDKVPFKALTGTLGRSNAAIIQKAYTLGLPERGTDYYMTVLETADMLGVKPDVIRGWEGKGLKLIRVRGIRNTLVDYGMLLEFMEKHQDLYRADLINLDMMTIRPDWFKKKYHKDKNKPLTKSKGNQYTLSEDSLIKQMYEAGKSDQYIADRLHRTRVAIKVHRADLGLMRDRKGRKVNDDIQKG